MARCQFNDLLAPGVEEWIGLDQDGGDTLLDERGEGGLEFSFAADFGDGNSSPSVRAAASTSFICGSAVGRPGLNSPPTTRACGISSRSNSSRFATTSSIKSITPVILPPGRFRLATRPSWTGSDPTTKTTGIVEDAAFAARAEGGPPVAAITETGRLTNSATSAGNRSARPSAQL